MHITPEFQFLEKICYQQLNQSSDISLQELLERTDFSWGELLEQGARHRLLPSVSYALENEALGKYVPKKVRSTLNDLRYIARRRAVVFQRYARAVSCAFANAEITHSVRKGLVTQHLLYEVPYLRIYSDLDFLVALKDAKIVRETLGKLGFTEGYFEDVTESIVPIPRAEAIRLRLNPDHLPRFSMGTDDEVVRHVEVDVATSLTWTNSGYEVSIDDALNQKQLIESGPLSGVYRLNDAFLFLDSVLHLFREAYLEITIATTGEDVNLAKFLDVALLWKILLRDKSVRDSVMQIIDDSNIKGAVGWVAYHTDSVFGTSILQELGLQREVTSEFLNSWRASGGKIGQWSGTMKERLQQKNRQNLFR
jgi:hypothetical protein